MKGIRPKKVGLNTQTKQNTVGTETQGESAEKGEGLHQKLVATERALHVAIEDLQFQKYRDSMEEKGKLLFIGGDLEKRGMTCKPSFGRYRVGGMHTLGSGSLEGEGM